MERLADRAEFLESFEEIEDEGESESIPAAPETTPTLDDWRGGGAE